MSTLINNATIKVRRDTSSSWTTNNPTPNQGEWCLETDTGNMKIGDGSTTWTSLAYYIPANLANTYDLTSENKTHTLPEITGAPQTVSVYWTNGGTYKLRIKKDDGTYLDYEGEGEGHILLESDGSNWQVREYEDSGNVDNSDGLGSKWVKHIDGNGELWTTTGNHTCETSIVGLYWWSSSVSVVIPFTIYSPVGLGISFDNYGEGRGEVDVSTNTITIRGNRPDNGPVTIGYLIAKFRWKE